MRSSALKGRPYDPYGSSVGTIAWGNAPEITDATRTPSPEGAT